MMTQLFNVHFWKAKCYKSFGCKEPQKIITIVISQVCVKFIHHRASLKHQQLRHKNMTFPKKLTNRNSVNQNNYWKPSVTRNQKVDNEI